MGLERERERERETDRKRIKRTNANSNIEGTRSREGIERRSGSTVDRRAIFLNRACSRRKAASGSVLGSRSGQSAPDTSEYFSGFPSLERSPKLFQHPRRARRIDGTRSLRVDRLSLPTDLVRNRRYLAR